MNKRNALEGASTIVVAAVAIAMAAAYFVDRRGEQNVDYDSSEIIVSWEDEIRGGVRLGPKNADVVITEFIDLECPYCAKLAPTIDSIANAHPTRVAIVFHHFTLASHENAVPAAIALECAGRQGMFWPMYRALLAGQDEFGATSWETFAERERIPNISAFSACNELPVDSFPRIAEGKKVGRRTGVRATPTAWVNGRIAPPNARSVLKMVDDVLRQ